MPNSSRALVATWVRASWLHLACTGTALFVLGSPVSPACARSEPGSPPALRSLTAVVHDAGRVRTLMTNWGVTGSRPGTSGPYSQAPSAEWPAPGAAEYLWAGGLWIGAIKNGEPHVSTAAYTSEFRPGRSPVDSIYATHEGAAGGARRPSPDADDDHDGRTDEDRPDGRDNDGDGRIDEDFAAVSQQMFACEYSDTDTSIVGTSPQHVPLEIQVQQSSLAWGTAAHGDIIGFDLRIINRGFNPLDNVYVGYFADCDIGLRSRENASEDDQAGFWEGRRAIRVGDQLRSVTPSLGYMFDADADDGTAPGYIGFLFLGAGSSSQPALPNQSVMLRNFRMFSGRAGFQQGGDPTDDAERYLVLSGAGPDSLPPADPESGFRPAQQAARDDDYRILISIGPFVTVEPGDTLNVQMAMVLGDGFEGMCANAVQAKALYDGVWYDCDHDPTTGVLGRESPVCAPDTGYVRINPCDSLCDGPPPGTPQCVVRIPAEGCAWVNGDCAVEAETGLYTGIDGKECQVHWSTPETVPVEIQDLEAAAAADGGVHLTWRIPDVAGRGVVFVERAGTPEGPFVRLTEDGMPPAASMLFDDVQVEPGHSYWYRVVLARAAGIIAASAPVHAVVGIFPAALELPVVQGPDAIRIAYRMNRSGPVDLAMFDVAGRRVRTLVRGTAVAGSHATVWDRRSESGARLVRGIYFVRFEAAGTHLARKVVLATP